MSEKKSAAQENARFEESQRMGRTDYLWILYPFTMEERWNLATDEDIKNMQQVVERALGEIEKSYELSLLLDELVMAKPGDTLVQKRAFISTRRKIIAILWRARGELGI